MHDYGELSLLVLYVDPPTVGSLYCTINVMLSLDYDVLLSESGYCSKLQSGSKLKRNNCGDNRLPEANLLSNILGWAPWAVVCGCSLS